MDGPARTPSSLKEHVPLDGGKGLYGGGGRTVGFADAKPDLFRPVGITGQRPVAIVARTNGASNGDPHGRAHGDVCRSMSGVDAFEVIG